VQNSQVKSIANPEITNALASPVLGMHPILDLTSAHNDTSDPHRASRRYFDKNLLTFFQITVGAPTGTTGFPCFPRREAPDSCCWNTPHSRLPQGNTRHGGELSERYVCCHTALLLLVL